MCLRRTSRPFFDEGPKGTAKIISLEQMVSSPEATANREAVDGEELVSEACRYMMVEEEGFVDDIIAKTALEDDTDESEDRGRAPDNLEIFIRSMDPPARADGGDSSDPEVANDTDKRKEGPW